MLLYLKLLVDRRQFYNFILSYRYYVIILLPRYPLHIPSVISLEALYYQRHLMNGGNDKIKFIVSCFEYKYKLSFTIRTKAYILTVEISEWSERLIRNFS